jgi:hypothetical protein
MKKKHNITTINNLTKKNNEKRIKRTTPEPIWIIKQPDVNLVERNQNEKSRTSKQKSALKKKKTKQYQVNLLNLI